MSLNVKVSYSGNPDLWVVENRVAPEYLVEPDIQLDHRIAKAPWIFTTMPGIIINLQVNVIDSANRLFGIKADDDTEMIYGSGW